MREFPVGVIVHYYARLGVGVIELEEPLLEGDEIHIEGHTTDFEQTVRSMEINHRRIRTAWPGDSVALLVEQRVRPGDRLFVRDKVQDREKLWERELVGSPV